MKRHVDILFDKWLTLMELAWDELSHDDFRQLEDKIRKEISKSRHALDSSGFHLDDIVTWSSQAQAFSKTKIGVIVEIVPVRGIPDRELFPDLYRGSGVGLCGRNEVSYVVRVERKHYWPRVKHLKKVEVNEKETL